MKRRRSKFAAICIISTVLGLFVIWELDLRSQQMEVDSFLHDPSMFANVTKMSFTGQGISVEIDDSESIRCFNTSLRASELGYHIVGGGVVYAARLQLLDGSNLELRVTICDQTSMCFDNGNAEKWRFRTLWLPTEQPPKLENAVKKLLSMAARPATLKG